MPNKKGQKEMVNSDPVAAVSQPEKKLEDNPDRPVEDEKIEVFIKEFMRIRPQDFQAFKHALEDFVKSWD